jgi:mannose-1-phosphate guanylyltransferase
VTVESHAQSPHTRIWVLILAGGAGTRFWPASRVARPKQLLPLTGGDPLIVETARRVLPLCGGWEQILVASGAHLAAPTMAQLPALPQANLLVEPVPRNTAPCIAWAAATVARTDPDAVLVVLPSDHHIADPERFRAVLSRCIESAQSGVITTIGIRPTHAETGYGYIEIDGLPEGDRAVRAKRFVEKPDRARAEAFFTSGRFLWNAGMFIFRARDMLAAVRAHLPDLAAGLAAFDQAAAEGRETSEVDQRFGMLPAVSIDVGVMERLDQIAVVPGDFGWSDVGSWQSAWELASKDTRGNSSPEGTILVDASNNHVVDLRTPSAAEAPSRRVIALVGVDDLVVVETDDALLVVPRARAQDVKEIVDQLKKRGDRGRY